MDSHREYIRSINFFEVDAYECSLTRISKCVVQTNLFNYIFATPDGIRYTIDVHLLNKNFEKISGAEFVGAQLFRVSDDIEELKFDEIFSTRYDQYKERHWSFKYWTIKYIKFTTSNGIFYIVITFFDPKKSPKDMICLVEQI